jgi:hypothetical protein
MVALYVHDDRVGPYQRVDFFAKNGALGIASHYGQDPHSWVVRYVLIPLHAKIRVPITGLLDIAIDTLGHITSAFRKRGRLGQLALTFECSIERPDTYLRGILERGGSAGPTIVETLMATVSMSRYVGILHLVATDIGSAQVLIDTTSTMKNLHFLAVTYLGKPAFREVFATLATKYQCPLITA